MKQERYEVDGKGFVLCDPELGLDLIGTLGKKREEFFESGQKKSCFYLFENQLHGPSRYFAKDGQLLSETWFYKGKKVGKRRAFYLSGAPYCIEQYYNGEKHLAQKYYYPEGSVKTITHYTSGVIDGDVLLYWPNGSLKRKALFKLGEPVNEEFFNEEGGLLGAV